jgi:hypothetical protein
MTGCPTTMRYSRRVGEQWQHRDAHHAQWLEGPDAASLTLAKVGFWSLWAAAVLAVGALALAAA